jgi:hypothetical protein
MELTPQEYINSLSLDDFSLLVIQGSEVFQEMVFEVALRLLQNKRPVSELLDYIEHYQHVGYKTIVKHLKKEKNG